LSRPEARPSRCPSAIPLKQGRITHITHLSNGTVATDLDAHSHNTALTAQGYTIRHIETWTTDDTTSTTCIIWDAPQITEADLPF
jgi:hypothetical protein